jgi:hypothetical protein
MTGTTPPRLLRQRRFVPAHPRRRSRGSPAPLLALPPRVRPERRAVRAARPSLAPTELAVRDGGPVKSQVSQRDSLGARPVTGISKTRWWSCLVPYLALPLGGELQELERSRLVGLFVVGKDHVVVCTTRMHSLALRPPSRRESQEREKAQRGMDVHSSIIEASPSTLRIFLTTRGIMPSTLASDAESP